MRFRSGCRVCGASVSLENHHFWVSLLAKKIVLCVRCHRLVHYPVPEREYPKSWNAPLLRYLVEKEEERPRVGEPSKKEKNRIRKKDREARSAFKESESLFDDARVPSLAELFKGDSDASR